MSKLSKTEIKVDRNFDKVVKDHVTKNLRRTLCFSIRGSQAVLSGEENSVELARGNLENMTVADLLEAMKVMDNEEEMSYKTTERVEFPPMKVKFKGHLWTLQKARDQLITYLNIVGFGKGGTKKFKEAADEPDGWPDQHSFETFEHPSYANMNAVNDVIESLLKHHGVDAYKHPFLVEEPETPPSKKNKKKVKKVPINMDDEIEDPNDNTLDEAASDDNAEKVAGTRARGEKRKRVPYEELRANNISERENIALALGILPHSKVRKEWERNDMENVLKHVGNGAEDND